MKKLLGLTLALAMIATAGANAEMLKDFKLYGNLDIQTTSARNIKDFVTRPTPVRRRGPGAAAENNDRISRRPRDRQDGLGPAGRRALPRDPRQGSYVVSASPRVYGAAAQNVNQLQDSSFIQEANVRSTRCSAFSM